MWTNPVSHNMCRTSMRCVASTIMTEPRCHRQEIEKVPRCLVLDLARLLGVMMGMRGMWVMDGMMLIMVMVLQLRLMMRVLVSMLIMGIGPHGVALSASNLLFVLVTRAQSSAILLVPCAQRLAAKHEIIVLDNGGYHPCVGVVKLYLVHCWVRDVEIRNKHVGLADRALR